MLSLAPVRRRVPPLVLLVVLQVLLRSQQFRLVHRAGLRSLHIFSKRRPVVHGEFHARCDLLVGAADSFGGIVLFGLPPLILVTAFVGNLARRH